MLKGLGRLIRSLSAKRMRNSVPDQRRTAPASSKTLTSLPPELLSEIAKQLPTFPSPDVKALSLVCRKLRRPSQDELLRRPIVVDGPKDFYRLHGSPFRGGGALSILEQAGKVRYSRSLQISLINVEDLLRLLRTNPRAPPSVVDVSPVYPPLSHLIDFLIRLPNLDKLTVGYCPYLSIPSHDVSRLQQPLNNITSLTITTLRWDRDHAFLRSITQLTPQLSTLTLCRPLEEAGNDYTPCSSPLPHLPNLKHLHLLSPFYLALGQLNLIAPQQGSTITHVDFYNCGRLADGADLPPGYGTKLGQLLTARVRHFEWREGANSLRFRQNHPCRLHSSLKEEMNSMMKALPAVYRITTKNFSREIDWVFSSLSTSAKILRIDQIMSKELEREIMEVIKSREADGREGLRGKILCLKGKRSSEEPFDDLWMVCAHAGIEVQYTELP